MTGSPEAEGHGEGKLSSAEVKKEEQPPGVQPELGAEPGLHGEGWGGGEDLEEGLFLQIDLPLKSSTLAPLGFPSESLTDTLLPLAGLSMVLSLGSSDKHFPLQMAPEQLASLALSVSSNSS